MGRPVCKQKGRVGNLDEGEDEEEERGVMIGRGVIMERRSMESRTEFVKNDSVILAREGAVVYSDCVGEWRWVDG